MLEQFIQSLDFETLATQVVGYFPSVIAAIITLLGSWLLFVILRRPIKLGLERGGLAPELVRLLVDSVLRYGMLAFALVMAIDQLGFNVAAAIAGLGIDF